jgi:two-component system cell cycle response regulator
VAARILIIDDNPANAQLMARLLGEAGHTPLPAPDAAAGVRAARAQPPDLVVCDIDLRHAGRAAAAFKRDPALARVPLLALAGAAARAHLHAAGFDGYIGKPIEPASFVAELEASLPAAGAPAAGPPTLLLVDDDAFMLDVLADLLAREGWRILAARSGAEALALLAHEQAQVILCDQCMPGMTGADLLARARRLYPSTFRIILSAQSEAGAIAHALRDGDADRFHAKPWNGAALAAALREAFALQRARARL